MAQKKHYEQLSFKIVNLSNSDIICESSNFETNDGQIEDSIWWHE